MNFPALFGKLTRWAQARPDLNFVMFTRAGCHLCDQAWEQLVEAQKQYGFTLEQRDVDGDAELVACHGNCVPVVAVNGKVRFRGAVNSVLLKRLLDAPVGED
jgi:hypothetical protein